MDLPRRHRLEKLLSKCEDILEHFKNKRRANFVRYGHTTIYDDHVKRLLTLTGRLEEEICGIDTFDDDKVINNLFNEYDTIDDNASNLQQKLIDSLQKEFENIDKEIWYNEHFSNWKHMPERQECDMYQLPERLHYSKCRHKMFDHLEVEWKRTLFTTLYNRIEFF